MEQFTGRSPEMPHGESLQKGMEAESQIQEYAERFAREIDDIVDAGIRVSVIDELLHTLPEMRTKAQEELMRQVS